MAETGDKGDLQAQLDALRASGAADRDPVRFAYIEALARRRRPPPHSQKPSVRRLTPESATLPANSLAFRL